MTQHGQQHRKTGFAFDLDGTLIDTEKHKAVCHQETIAYFGGKASADLYYRFIGNSFADVFYQLKKLTGIKAGPTEYQEIFNKFYLKGLQGHWSLKPVKGATDLLEAIKARGFGIALVTSSQRWMMDMIAEQSGLTGYFTAMVSGDDVAHNKPAPDPYLLAARLLTAETVFAFEDTRPGIQSAKEAGAIVFGIKNTHNTRDDLSAAENIYNDFTEVDLESILSRYQRP